MERKKEFLLKIGDIGFHARWSTRCTRYVKDRCYKGFLFHSGIEDEAAGLRHYTEIDFSHSAGKLKPLRSKDIIFHLPDYWTLYRSRDGYYLERFDTPTKRRMSISHIKKGLSKVIYYPEKEKSWDSGFLFQPLIRYLFANIMARNCGLMVHGAAVKIGDRAIAFVGRSGSGKTTISEIFRKAGVKVLTDENIAVMKRDGIFRACGTPWPGGGRMAQADSAPLGAVCFISHGIKNSLEKIGAKAAARNILQQAVVQAWDPDSISGIFDTVNALASDAPCFEMPFVNDKSVVEFVMRNLVK